jgi:ABC-type nitrate/sulfonate/bicarbonate transport system substrate-binding protein
MKARTIRRFTLAAIGSVGIFAVTAAWAETPVIKIGYLAQAHDGPLMNVEKALGSDYRIEYVKFLRYTDAEIALANGDLQVASLGYVSAITAASRGGDPKFQFVVGQSRGAINLVCRDDVKINGWADLKSHTYGVLTGGPAEIFFDQALAQHGIQAADIKKISFAVPGPPLLQALKDSAIDCTAVYEPFAASAVADGRATYPPVDLAENPFSGINGGIAVNVEFLKSNLPFVRKLVDASVKAADEFPRNKPDWIATVVAKTGFPAKTMTLAVDHVILDWRLYPDRVEILANAVAALGTIKQLPSKAALARYFDLSFTQGAEKR